MGSAPGGVGRGEKKPSATRRGGSTPLRAIHPRRRCSVCNRDREPPREPDRADKRFAEMPRASTRRQDRKALRTSLKIVALRVRSSQATSRTRSSPASGAELTTQFLAPGARVLSPIFLCPSSGRHARGRETALRGGQRTIGATRREGCETRHCRTSASRPLKHGSATALVRRKHLGFRGPGPVDRSTLRR